MSLPLLQLRLGFLLLLVGVQASWAPALVCWQQGEGAQAAAQAQACGPLCLLLLLARHPLRVGCCQQSCLLLLLLATASRCDQTGGQVCCQQQRQQQQQQLRQQRVGVVLRGGDPTPQAQRGAQTLQGGSQGEGLAAAPPAAAAATLPAGGMPAHPTPAGTAAVAAADGGVAVAVVQEGVLLPRLATSHAAAAAAGGGVAAAAAAAAAARAAVSAHATVQWQGHLQQHTEYDRRTCTVFSGHGPLFHTM